MTRENAPAGAGRRLLAVLAGEQTLGERLRQGWLRVHAAFWPVIQAAIAAVIAFLLGRHLLGHATPFFAAIAAWACLGFGTDRTIRRVFEVGIGVVMGVAIGDLVVLGIGSGWWQLGSVLVVSALLSRFVDDGAVLATQAGTQAIVIVGLPDLAGGPYGRALDTTVGVAVALLMVLLLPGNQEGGLRRQGQASLGELAKTVQLLAAGIATGSASQMNAALEHGRFGTPVIEEWERRAASLADQARFSVNRRRRPTLLSFHAQAVQTDRAMRTIRVVARRAPAVVPDMEDPDRARLAGLLTDYGDAIRAFQTAIGRQEEMHAVAARFRQIHQQASPEAFSADNPDGWGARALVLLLRIPIRDLADAADGEVAADTVAMPLPAE